MADDARPSRPSFQSSDTLEVPAFFANDRNAAELEAWKREHPDWFVAGWWTPAPRKTRRERLVPPTPAPFKSGPSSVPSMMAATSVPSPSADAPLLSVADFLAIGKAARSGGPSGMADAVQSAQESGPRETTTIRYGLTLDINDPMMRSDLKVHQLQ